MYVERFGNTKDEIFVTASELRHELGDEEFEKVPTGASVFTRITSDWPRDYAS